MSIKVIRVYEYIKREKNPDEYVVLVDRLWPRGVAKISLDIDEWLKDIAPSNNLRKWFNHEDHKWEEFVQRYKDELKLNQKEIQRLREIAGHKELVILYSAKNTEFNQAKVLQKMLNDKFGI